MTNNRPPHKTILGHCPHPPLVSSSLSSACFCLPSSVFAIFMPPLHPGHACFLHPSSVVHRTHTPLCLVSRECGLSSSLICVHRTHTPFLSLPLVSACFRPPSSTFAVLTHPFVSSPLVSVCFHPPSSVFAVLTHRLSLASALMVVIKSIIKAEVRDYFGDGSPGHSPFQRV